MHTLTEQNMAGAYPSTITVPIPNEEHRAGGGIGTPITIEGADANGGLTYTAGVDGVRIRHLGANEQTREEKTGIMQSRRGLGAYELALVTRQMATLIQAGIPLEETLKAVARQTEKPVTQSLLLAVRGKVLEGYPLAQSMAGFPRAFPDLYRATVAAAQVAEIQAITKAESQTFAQVAEALNMAGDIDTLDAKADLLIKQVADEAQRTELTDLYHVLRIKLEI
jgi:hypothetical protein